MKPVPTMGNSVAQNVYPSYCSSMKHPPTWFHEAEGAWINFILADYLFADGVFAIKDIQHYMHSFPQFFCWVKCMLPACRWA